MHVFRPVAIASAAALLAACATTPSSGPMGFFITSAGSGKGADLGGLAGADAHCQRLASAAGAGAKTWRAYLSHADIKVPGIFKFIIKWVTPTLLLFVFVGAFFKPVNNDWSAVFQGTWILDDGSVINTILNSGLHKKIAATTDATQLVELNKQLTFINWSRLLLVATFAGIAALVYIAYRKRVKEGRWV